LIRRDELRETLRLALPVVVTQVGHVAMGTVDTLMVGRLGAEALSAVGLGNSVGFMPLIIGMGILMGLDPIVSQAYGAGRFEQCGRAMRHGLLVAAALAVPIVCLLLQARWLLRLLGEPPELVDASAPFLRVWSYGVPPFLAFTALRQFLQGIGTVKAPMWIMLGANLLNALVNWMLIYGNAGAPALGVVGSAWATTLSRWAMCAALALYVFGRGDFRRFRVLAPRGKLDRTLLTRLWRLGAPVGMQYGMEAGLFTAATVMMGWLGTTSLASHQVAINLCSITFMVPFGFAATASVRVGHAIGRDDVGGARHAAFLCYLLGVGFMGVAALVFAFAATALARLYTGDAAVVALASQLLLVGAAFQLFDGAQTIGIGALRGAADTRVPMFLTIAAYWLVGLPIGWWLAFRGGMGAIGVWWGLTAALVVVAVTLALRFHVRVREEHLVLLKAHA
jgi:MATE family multidrug resistance protein